MMELMPHVAVLVGIWIMMGLAMMVVTPVMLHSWAPNWSKAIRSLPVPRDLGKRSGWKNSWVRDRPGAQFLFMPCMVSYSEQGVLVRDLWHNWWFLLGLFSKHYTMFIPWTACSNPRESWRHRWYATSLQRSLVELDVAGQQFSILVHPCACPANLKSLEEGEELIGSGME